MVMVDGSAGVGFRAIHWPATGTPNTGLTRGIDEMFKIWYYDCDQELMDCIDTENEFVQVGEMDTLRFK